MRSRWLGPDKHQSPRSWEATCPRRGNIWENVGSEPEVQHVEMRGPSQEGSAR